MATTSTIWWTGICIIPIAIIATITGAFNWRSWTPKRTRCRNNRPPLPSVTMTGVWQVESAAVPGQRRAA
jgi:hypothetical protein